MCEDNFIEGVVGSDYTLSKKITQTPQNFLK